MDKADCASDPWKVDSLHKLEDIRPHCECKYGEHWGHHRGLRPGHLFKGVARELGRADEWFVKEVQPRLEGKCFIIRWADDFLIGFENEADALRVKEVLPKRFDRYGLELHPEKTTLVSFARPSTKVKSEARRGTFDFLGFTHYWAKTREGYSVIKKKTAGKRLRRFMRTMWLWCKEKLHDPITEQWKTLKAKLRGYYQYFGVRSNYKAIEAAYEHTYKAWRYWLSRRSQRKEVLFEFLQNNFPLPKPRIVHSI